MATAITNQFRAGAQDYKQPGYTFRSYRACARFASHFYKHFIPTGFDPIRNLARKQEVDGLL
jgi:hypothetical protein